MQQLSVQKAALVKEGELLQKFINQYDGSVKVADLADKSKLLNFYAEPFRVALKLQR